MSRTKGHAFERLVAAVFREIFPRACRQLEYQEGLGVDLAHTGRLNIQCKRGRQYAPLSKLAEARRGGGGIPALVTQGDRQEALIALPLADFIEILRNPFYVLGDETHAEAPTRRDRDVAERDAERADKAAG